MSFEPAPTPIDLRASAVAILTARLTPYIDPSPEAIAELLVRDLEDLWFPVPAGATVGDYTSVLGALVTASASWVDWEQLANGDERSAIGPPAIILLCLINLLRSLRT
jgi:hypothetical protein